ncbi:MAG: response regulator [Magnetococcus sp. YQC-9]
MTTILCVEDDAQQLNLYRRLLEEQGYAVLTAENGLTGLALLQSNRVDLVLTDIIMPDMDGVELICRILAMRPPPVIVAISGGGQYLTGLSLLKTVGLMGVRHTLLKPFTGKILLNAVWRALQDTTPDTNRVQAAIGWN